MDERRLIILGSTDSIGRQALDVVAHLNALAEERPLPAGLPRPPRYRVVGLAAGKRAAEALEQAQRFGVRNVALRDGDGVTPPAGVTLLRGDDAAERLVREVDADIVLAAMVGAAGLPATLAAVEAGRDVALANKETLVAAGELVVPAARASGSHLLPVDSEHAAIWQCLQDHSTHRELCPPCAAPSSVERLILTASGGPFRAWPLERVRNATPAEALNHPTWRMGPKVTIDSASLTNKALEVIEAHWLFGLPADSIDVLIHPQSIVHSMVEFIDGNLIAQLGPNDMRVPIQTALTFPQRAPRRTAPLDLARMGRLDFEEPDLDRFPALQLAYDALRAGGTAGAILNAANEAAVEAFLREDGPGLPFGQISELTRQAMQTVGAAPINSLQDVLEADQRARQYVLAQLTKAPPRQRPTVNS
jgi:1-deoxy-D-xylulose-5-phosphate reductoisomerase